MLVGVVLVRAQAEQGDNILQTGMKTFSAGRWRAFGRKLHC